MLNKLTPLILLLAAGFSAGACNPDKIEVLDPRSPGAPAAGVPAELQACLDVKAQEGDDAECDFELSAPSRFWSLAECEVAVESGLAGDACDFRRNGCAGMENEIVVSCANGTGSLVPSQRRSRREAMSDEVVASRGADGCLQLLDGSFEELWCLPDEKLPPTPFDDTVVRLDAEEDCATIGTDGVGLTVVPGALCEGEHVCDTNFFDDEGSLLDSYFVWCARGRLRMVDQVAVPI